MTRSSSSRLNAALRAGKYHDSLFETATGKTLDDLWAEFTESLLPHS